MKFTISSVAAVMLATAVAAPVEKRAAVTDADILQFALTLEHLENSFYKGAISTMPESDFLAAGFSADYYNNLKYIVHDEEVHVQALTAALTAAGADPVAACTYKFPYTDPKSFVTLSSVLEGVGTAAYLGAAPLITNKAYLGVAGSILVTEAIHTSLQRFTIGEVAPANPYGSALGLNPVYTLAAAFIESCPSTNAALPVMAFPNFVSIQGQPTAPGIGFMFSMVPMPSGEMYVTFVSGLVTVSMAATVADGKIMTRIPDTVSGQTYAFLTNTNVTSSISDSQILAGPAILEVTPTSPTFDISQQ